MADAMSHFATFDLDHERHSGRLFYLYPSFRHMKDHEYDHMTLMDRYHTKHAKFYWASQELEKKAWGQFSNDLSSRGKAWEAHIHHLIQTCGVCGTLKNLGTCSTTEDFTLHYPKAGFFQTFEQIDGSAQYWQPVSKRHPTCDAYIPNDGIMLQMAVGEQHTINMNGLEASLKSNIFKQWENDHPDKLLKFIFIVDTAVYEEYIGDQSFRYTKTSNKADSERKKEARRESVECRVEQYILKVDLESRLKELRCGAGCKRGWVDEDDEMRRVKKIESICRKKLVKLAISYYVRREYSAGFVWTLASYINRLPDLSS